MLRCRTPLQARSIRRPVGSRIQHYEGRACLVRRRNRASPITTLAVGRLNDRPCTSEQDSRASGQAFLRLANCIPHQTRTQQTATSSLSRCSMARTVVGRTLGCATRRAKRSWKPMSTNSGPSRRRSCTRNLATYFHSIRLTVHEPDRPAAWLKNDPPGSEIQIWKLLARRLAVALSRHLVSQLPAMNSIRRENRSDPPSSPTQT